MSGDNEHPQPQPEPQDPMADLPNPNWDLVEKGGDQSGIETR